MSELYLHIFLCATTGDPILADGIPHHDYESAMDGLWRELDGDDEYLHTVIYKRDGSKSEVKMTEEAEQAKCLHMLDGQWWGECQCGNHVKHRAERDVGYAGGWE